MIAIVVYGREECSAAKNRSHYDFVIFMEQPGIALVYPLSVSAEGVLMRLKPRFSERYISGEFSYRRYPYDTMEFVYSLDEGTFLGLLRELVPEIEVRVWKRQTRGQRFLVLCFSCRENCRLCFSKFKPG